MGKKSTHPTSSVMVIEAVTALQERKGSSLQAIKKYIAVNYIVDAEKMARYIRQAIVKNVEDGVLVRVRGKGVGATGSFKLAPKGKKPAAPRIKLVAPKKKKKKAPAVKKDMKPKQTKVKSPKALKAKRAVKH